MASKMLAFTKTVPANHSVDWTGMYNRVFRSLRGLKTICAFCEVDKLSSGYVPEISDTRTLLSAFKLYVVVKEKYTYSIRRIMGSLRHCRNDFRLPVRLFAFPPRRKA